MTEKKQTGLPEDELGELSEALRHILDGDIEKDALKLMREGLLEDEKLFLQKVRKELGSTHVLDEELMAKCVAETKRQANGLLSKYKISKELFALVEIATKSYIEEINKRSH